MQHFKRGHRTLQYSVLWAAQGLVSYKGNGYRLGIGEGGIVLGAGLGHKQKTIITGIIIAI